MCPARTGFAPICFVVPHNYEVHGPTIDLQSGLDDFLFGGFVLADVGCGVHHDVHARYGLAAG